jgi:hypothetical protein
MDLLCAIHESGEGEITGKVEQLSRLCRCNPDQMLDAINELIATKTAGVTICHSPVTELSQPCHSNVTVVSRRFKRAHIVRKKAADRQRDSRASQKSHKTPRVRDNSVAPPRPFSSSSSLKKTTTKKRNAVTVGSSDPPESSSSSNDEKNYDIATVLNEYVSMRWDLGKIKITRGGYKKGTAASWRRNPDEISEARIEVDLYLKKKQREVDEGKRKEIQVIEMQEFEKQKKEDRDFLVKEFYSQPKSEITRIRTKAMRELSRSLRNPNTNFETTKNAAMLNSSQIEIFSKEKSEKLEGK